MAAAISSSPSSSTVSPRSNYHVFLSFRGETRDNFTSHLFAALSKKKINTFMDEAINKGDKIAVELLNAKIKGSRISVIIFSPDYASSKWCLEELVTILECKENNGQIVIPVFYHVHPSDVRNQTGSFKKSFVGHEKKYKKMPDKVQKWRDALTEASYLAGHESTKIRREADLVDIIVKDVLKKLEDMRVSPDFDGLIGINSRIEQVKSLLCMGSSDFLTVGIWGMGGIGKTTLAEAIFKQGSPDFDGKCFISNVREKTQIGGGLEQLENEVLSHLLEENIEKGGSSIPHYTKERLQNMKIFIVLDDVNKFGQLEYLVRRLGPFSQESRIIITTRDKQVLHKNKVNVIYNVEGLNFHEAFEHFRNYAFTENHCPEDFMLLSERAVDRAKGNPLALKILGSLLRCKSKRDWEIALDNLKLISDPDIYDVLQMSYKELHTNVQQIFLDIACFFKGDDKDHVASISHDPYSTRCALDILIEKSLITISCNKLEMHDLLQEMGQEIVRQESEEEPEQRSRLWYHKDILYVLNEKKGTNSIKGIFLDMSKIRDINLDSGAFKNMSELRLLKFYMPKQFGDMSSKVGLPQGLEYLSDKVRYLHWHGYPLKTLPMSFSAENLIELSLPYSKIEQLWEENKKAVKLKFIDLHHSESFNTIPNPSEAPNLERLILLRCMKLSHIPQSIQNFSNLGILCLEGCNSLKCFPRNIHFRCPITIDLSYCDDLTEFPQISGKILELNLRGTAIEEVLPSIESLTDLRRLDLTFCENLKAVSTSICKLKSLCYLALDYCSMLEGFPEILEKMEYLEYIGLKSTAIKELPPSIEYLQGLKTLSLMECSELNSLPENLGNLKSLKFIHGKRLAISQLPSSITDLEQLEKLLLSGCRGLVLPSLSGLCSLKTFELDDCNIMEIPPDIGRLSSLESLNLKGNDFQSLPSSMKELGKLRELILSNCNNLRSLPELPLYLFRLEAMNCKQLKSLPKLPSRLQEIDAFVLEKLSKQYTCNKAAICMELDFSNSLGLNENTADSQLRIYHMAFASLKQFCENVSNYSLFLCIFLLDISEFMIFIYILHEISVPCGVSICLPGSEIPDWFSNRISGSSINIQQPLYCDRKFIGFALCAVVSFEEAFEADEDFVVVSKYRSNTKTLSKTEHVNRQFVFKTIKNNLYAANVTNCPTHIYLGFDPCSIVGLSDSVSFDFFIDSVSKFEKGPKVKHCGVCPINVHLMDSKPDTFTLQSLFGVIGGKSATSQQPFSHTFTLRSLFGSTGGKSATSQRPSSITNLWNLRTNQFFVRRGLVLTTLATFSHAIGHLELGGCGIMEIPPDIGCLASLQKLNLQQNNFESLPTSIKQLSKLRTLILSNCNMLRSLPALPPCLYYLEARNCMQLQSLPNLPSHLEFEASVWSESCNQPHGCVIVTRLLDFSNCMKLNEDTNNNILADSQLWIRHMAISSLRPFHEEEEISVPHRVREFFDGRKIPATYGVSICLPGREIPDWFSHQSSGSLVHIQEPLLGFDSRFIGFALCAVLDFENYFLSAGPKHFEVNCECRVTTKTSFEFRLIRMKAVLTAFDNPLIYQSDHICLGFYPFLTHDNHLASPLSHFDGHFVFRSKQLIVKCCGVSPLYAHPTMTKPNTFTVNMELPSEEEYMILRRINWMVR